jgi:hypothetical protein
MLQTTTMQRPCSLFPPGATRGTNACRIIFAAGLRVKTTRGVRISGQKSRAFENDPNNPALPMFYSGMNRQEMNFMTMSALRFAGLSGATLLLAIALATGADAVGIESPQPQPQPITTPSAPPKADTKSDDKKSSEDKKEDKSNEKKSEQQFIDGYKAARAMVLGGQYEVRDCRLPAARP